MKTFRELNCRPILWIGKGATHLCEGAEVHPGVRPLWTLCGVDVPANEAIHPGSDDRATCSACLSKAAAENPGEELNDAFARGIEVAR